VGAVAAVVPGDGILGPRAAHEVCGPAVPGSRKAEHVTWPAIYEEGDCDHPSLDLSISNYVLRVT
jgi:hypothetical protein